MKTATVRDLRNEFSRISRWLEAGESVQVLRRGKPFARVVPEPKAKTFVGACPSVLPLPADLDDPVGADWEAEA
jgi:antitoxin (DNA-binding transcriptional repressor) of toxin-antitoxin stability system